MKKEKSETKFIFLNRYNNSRDILKISLETSGSKIVSANEVDNKKISTGFFEAEKRNDGIDIIALVATSAGPLLIFNSLQYFFELGRTKIDVGGSEKLSHFIVSHDSELIFELLYEEKVGVGSHPYNQGREDVDFYYWLSKNAGNPKLYDGYSKKMVSVVG